MWSFFLFLFGAIYLFGRMGVEKAGEAKCDREFNEVMSEQKCLEGKYAVSYKREQEYEQLILDGEHYDEICERFKDDFAFVFGSEWKDILSIPPMPPVLDPKVYKDDAYSFEIPVNHIYWVYRLMLADEGKICYWNSNRLKISGGTDEIKMQTKFVICIEKRLRNSGADIKYVFEPERTYSKELNKYVALGRDRGCHSANPLPENCVGDFIIEGTGFHETRRLWQDKPLGYTAVANSKSYHAYNDIYDDCPVPVKDKEAITASIEYEEARSQMFKESDSNFKAGHECHMQMNTDEGKYIRDEYSCN